MMKRKRLLATLLTLCMVFTLLPGMALAEGTNVAKIGEIEYATLTDAVAAANSGDTITLLSDASGAGIFLAAGDKTLTIDFSNKTYTCIGPAVGSTGTETQAMHLEAGNTVTLKNGTLKLSDLSSLKMGIQNYCDLTLSSFDVDASADSYCLYAVSNNSGTVNINWGSDITAYENTVAVDSCKFGSYPIPTVNFNNWTSAKITGEIELTGGKVNVTSGTFIGDFSLESGYNSGDLSIIGGTFSSDPTELINTETHQVYPTQNQYIVAEKDYYAFKFESASTGAISYSTSFSGGNGTSTLLRDYSTSSRMTFGSSMIRNQTCTLDLNGHTMTNSGSSSTYRAFLVTNGCDLTVKNGTINFTADDGFYLNTGHLTLEDDVTINAGSHSAVVLINGSTLNTAADINSLGTFAIAGNGTAGNGDTTVNVTGGIITSDVTAIYQPQSGALNISGGTITGATAVYAKSGNITISGGTLNGIGLSAEYNSDGDGANATGDALVIDNCGYPGGAPVVSVTGGTFNSSNASTVGSYAKDANFTALTGFISGGIYYTAPDETLIATGYQYNSDTKYVVPVAPENVAASIGDVGYPSLALAVNAAKYGDIIDLLSDNTEETELIVSKVITIRSNGYSIGNVSAGDGYVNVFDDPGLIFSISPIYTTVVSETVTAEIGEAVSSEDAEIIAGVINLTQVSGVSDALSQNGQDDIIDEAGVTLGAGDKIAVEINVIATALESNLDAGQLTFSVVPTADVYLNGEVQNGAPIPLSNSYLNGADIEVLLPLPEGFSPAEIIHRSSDGSSERFFESSAYTSAAKQFEIITINSYQFAKLTINKFSTFEILEEAGYAASIGTTNYNTLQEAIDAATSDQTITLLQDCSEAVNISGKSLAIERGDFSFDKAKITLGTNCSLEESGTTLTVTYAVPLTVTLLDIADAIAPINGRTPMDEIAETDQYTGTVTWTDASAVPVTQFAPNQTYTATIELTAKSGYTFEGITANAFKVPCAMSATNDINSGVITATFISPPVGYITDGNGTMAYCFNDLYDYHNFDIVGFFYNGWKQTTCGNIGYETQYKIGDAELTDIYATGEPLALGTSGLTLDVDFEFVSEGKALQVVYTVHNTGAENVSFSFGSHADTQIGNTDYAPISIFNPALEYAYLDRGFKMVSTSYMDENAQGDFAQFNFFGKRSVRVTDVDSFWYGGYWEKTSNLFTQVAATSYLGDSGMAYSWQNRTIGSGETQTYKVIIGIGGADSADVLGYSVAYDDNVPDTIITVPETQQKLENVALTISEQVPVRSGYEFDSWNTQSDGGGIVYNPGDIYTTNASLTLYAQWTQNDSPGSSSSYWITSSSNEGGTITPLGKTNIVRYSGKTYTITPEAGYKISDVLVDGISVGKVATYTFSSVISNHTIEVKFEHDCPSKNFTDVETSQWYHDGIDFVLANSLFNGTSDTTFEPNADMTRAMLVTVLWRLEKEPDSTITSLFEDLDEGAWYADGVAWAAENNIVDGYDADTFGPGDPITREQMATILYKYARYKDYDLTAANDLTLFDDAGDISSWALTTMKWAVAEELITGIGERSLAPSGNASRAQVAAILMRFVENVMN